MDLDTIGALLESAIPLLGGVYGSLIGFRKLGKRPGEDEKLDAWHAKHGKVLRWLGPLVALFGVVLAVQAVA